MERYNIIHEKRPREIVLLRGRGCAYGGCVFCDYHTDRCDDDSENYRLNKSVLQNVTGIYGDIEIINSGSVFELDEKTLELIRQTCRKNKIRTIHFESHYIYRSRISVLRRDFGDFELKMKLGLETFDFKLRESLLKKGINETDPAVISQGFDEANLLFGIDGQTAGSMKYDIETGLKYFERLCVNIMCPNSTAVKPSGRVIAEFKERLLPVYLNDRRVDILINNTDFGVGD